MYAIGIFASFASRSTRCSITTSSLYWRCTPSWSFEIEASMFHRTSSTAHFHGRSGKGFRIDWLGFDIGFAVWVRTSFFVNNADGCAVIFIGRVQGAFQSMITQSCRTGFRLCSFERGWRSMNDLWGHEVWGLKGSWVGINVVDRFETMTVERGHAFQWC